LYFTKLVRDNVVSKVPSTSGVRQVPPAFLETRFVTLSWFVTT